MPTVKWNMELAHHLLQIANVKGKMANKYHTTNTNGKKMATVKCNKQIGNANCSLQFANDKLNMANE